MDGDYDAQSAAGPAVLADPRKRVPGLLIDALDYVDSEIDAPGMRDRVDQLILEEMGRMAEGPAAYKAELPDVAIPPSTPAIAVSNYWDTNCLPSFCM